jgi:hypothetical protein
MTCRTAAQRALLYQVCCVPRGARHLDLTRGAPSPGPPRVRARRRQVVAGRRRLRSLATRPLESSGGGRRWRSRRTLAGLASADLPSLDVLATMATSPARLARADGLSSRTWLYGHVGHVRPRRRGESWLGMDTRPAAVRNFLAYTLTRLGLDHVDIYRPGRLDPHVPIEETVGAIADLVKAGYVRWIGLSEVGVDTIRRAHAVHPISDLQIEYSLISRGPEGRIFPVLRRARDWRHRVRRAVPWAAQWIERLIAARFPCPSAALHG